MSDKGVQNVTPVGILMNTFITGKGKLNYNEDGYNYVATVLLEGEAAQKEIEKIDEVLGDVPKTKTVKSKGYRKVFKKEKEDGSVDYKMPNQDGRIVVKDEDVTDEYEETEDMYAFQYSTSVEFPDGTAKEIAVYNKDAQKVKLGKKLIGNGSKGAISGTLKRYERGKEIGVSLFLDAVQVTYLNAYSNDPGFSAQEGEFDGVEDEETGFTGQPDESDDKEAPPKKKGKTKPRI